MKTTIEISDALLASAKNLAARQGTTLRALVETGLRQVLDKAENGAPFRLGDGTFEGRGLQPAFRNAGWEQIREAIYDDRQA